MPFRWTKHVSKASLITLPTYVFFFLSVGLSMTLTDKSYLRKTPVFDYVERISDLRLWGVGFLIMAALIIFALLTDHVDQVVQALAICALWMYAWSVVGVLAAFRDDASYAAWAWPLSIGNFCVATIFGMAKGDGDR